MDMIVIALVIVTKIVILIVIAIEPPPFGWVKTDVWCPASLHTDLDFLHNQVRLGPGHTPDTTARHCPPLVRWELFYL